LPPFFFDGLSALAPDGSIFLVLFSLQFIMHHRSSPYSYGEDHVFLFFFYLQLILNMYGNATLAFSGYCTTQAFLPCDLLALL